MSKIRLHKSLFILFSFIILFLIELLLHFFPIELKQKLFITDLPIIPTFDPDAEKGVLNEPPAFFIWDRYCLWRGKPNAEFLVVPYSTCKPGKIELNSIGLRNQEISEKEPGSYRIVNMGDSSTFGYSCLRKETYSFQLQNILDRNFPGKKSRL